MNTKQCASCKKDKPTSEFFRKTASKDGINRICKLCNAEYKKKRYQSMTPEQRWHHNERWQRKDPSKGSNHKCLSTYGITFEEAKMLRQGVCEICQATEKLCIDHDHSISRANIRGILCYHCNCAIGHFRDNPFLLQQAIIYLNKTRQ